MQWELHWIIYPDRQIPIGILSGISFCHFSLRGGLLPDRNALHGRSDPQ